MVSGFDAIVPGQVSGERRMAGFQMVQAVPVSMLGLVAMQRSAKIRRQSGQHAGPVPSTAGARTPGGSE